jgi:hypothetical protein
MLKTINKFSLTEADTVWQLIHCLEKIQLPRHRASLFCQILEEDHHAEEFKRVYEELAGAPMPGMSSPREYLYAEQDDLWKLYAYCYVGEEEAADKFRGILAKLESGPLKTAIQSILEDEEGHVGKAEKLMVEEGASIQALKSEIRKITIRRRWEDWLRLGKQVIEIPSRLIITACYFSLTPFFVMAAKKRLTQRTFSNLDNNFTSPKQ